MAKPYTIQPYKSTHNRKPCIRLDIRAGNGEQIDHAYNSLANAMKSAKALAAAEFQILPMKKCKR